MRLTFKDPRKLATCLKDLVDLYLDGIIEYDELQDKVKKLVETSEDRIYKNGFMSTKIAYVLGESRIEIVNKIMEQ